MKKCPTFTHEKIICTMYELSLSKSRKSHRSRNCRKSHRSRKSRKSHRPRKFYRYRNSHRYCNFHRKMHQNSQNPENLGFCTLINFTKLRISRTEKSMTNLANFTKLHILQYYINVRKS